MSQTRELEADDKAKLGRVLGMKPSEIIAAADVPDADPPALVVETHDGIRMRLVTEDGVHFELSRWDGPMPGADTDDEDDDTDVDVDEDEDGGSGDDETGDETDEGEDVPEGTADAVLAWVGDDKDRAARALTAELAREKPRSTLVGQLERIAQA